MATVLCISSEVVRGYVGGSAARAALERSGHQLWLLPTVILSNHPGHPRCGGEQVPAGRLGAMLDALAGNGWLEEADAVLTGYMPSAEHAGFAAMAARRLREVNPGALLLCDPIMGDDPGGLYVKEDVAAAQRDELAGAADIVTPNAFELGWMTGRTVDGEAAARDAAARLGRPTVLTTSVPGRHDGEISNLLWRDGTAWVAHVSRRSYAPHGTGDLMAALFLARLLEGTEAPAALAAATAGVEAALAACEGRDALRLWGAAAPWTGTHDWPVESLP
ncbi:MAG: pyridoxal kinase [Hyphomicrobiales bacterium]